MNSGRACPDHLPEELPIERLDDALALLVPAAWSPSVAARRL